MNNKIRENQNRDIVEDKIQETINKDTGINIKQDIKTTKSSQFVALIGAKSIGLYGGYESFVNKLTEYHAQNLNISYYVAVKANGHGSGKPKGLILNAEGYTFNNAQCFEIRVPEWLGSAQSIYYDCAALHKVIQIIKKKKIEKPIIYIMTCRIGLFFKHYVRQIKRLGGSIYLNPDGHEWLRAKWSAPIKKYWKISESLMVRQSDIIVCDSVNIENYIRETYKLDNTTYISYGADTTKSSCPEEVFENWLKKKGVSRGNYYLSVGRFVPENNYETIIREFMNSDTDKDLVIITNQNPPLYEYLLQELGFDKDKRIKFVGTVYDQELLKKIREVAFAYIHGHEVGGTNPSLLEALGSTSLNLLNDVKFNREVGLKAALYWTKEKGSLVKLIKYCDNLTKEQIEEFGCKAKDRINSNYSWEYIADCYDKLWKLDR